MVNKNLLAITILASILVISMSLVSAAGAHIANGAVNITITSIINGTLASTTNASTIVVTWTINNGTGGTGNSLAGFNFSYFLSSMKNGAAATTMVHMNICNFSSSSGTAQVPAGANWTACRGDGVTNSIYLNLSEGLHSIEINMTGGDVTTNAALNYSTSTNCSTGNPSGCNTSFWVNNFDTLNFTLATTTLFGNGNLSSSSIMVNVTFLSVVGNVTFYLWNGTSGIMTMNSTGAINNFTGPQIQGKFNSSSNLTWKNLVDGTYTLNVTLKHLDDPYNVSIKSISRIITLDTISPNQSSLSCSGWKNSVDLTVTKDVTNFRCTCSATDAFFNGTYLTYTYSPSTGETPSVSTLGQFGISCLARDSAGNNGTGSNLLLYTVVEADDSSGDNTGSGRTSSGTTSTAAITGKTNVVTTQALAEGATASLSSGDGFKISLTPSGATAVETHIVKVSKIETNSVTVVISSDPITATLNIGDEKKVDLNNDGTYDLLVKLNSITDGKANMTIKQISEPVSAQTGTGTGAQPTGNKVGISIWIWVLVIAVIIVVIAVVLMKRKK